MNRNTTVLERYPSQYCDSSPVYLYIGAHYVGLGLLMNQRQFNGRTDRFVRRYDYDDRTVLAADIGADDENVSVNTVDGTAIVVLQREGREEEFEIELPGAAANVDTQNGVLTITITQ